MTVEEILKNREKLFYKILEYYTKKAKEDKRYLKTCERLKKNKDNFLSGWTFVQCIKGNPYYKGDDGDV